MRASPKSFDAPTTLSDIVAPDLRILLVAINPATTSATAGLHFATARNPFWRLLHEAGLTPRQLAPHEARELVLHGIGLVSLVARPTRAAAELTRAEMHAGARALEVTVARLRPRTVALLGLTLFPFVFPDADEPGPGDKRVTLAGARVFVLPNPSGRNRAYPGVAAELVWYRALAESSAEGRVSGTK
jgi:TDG/mug DNA glycosylase family protein